MRRLIHIPIVHSAVDLGSMLSRVKEHYARIYGPDIWSRRELFVAELWNDIRNKLNALDIDYDKTRIYQDGLPVCGIEWEIVEELAQAGSANHQLILELVRKGAILMGTEDSQLLIQEYQLLHRDNNAPRDRSENVQEASRLLEARDKFIADRIDKTLQIGEIGLLFLGAAHRIDALKSPDIYVQNLLEMLTSTT